jgi:hypothetical protein
LTGHVTEWEKMGFAHKESFEADYEFLGYLVQFLVSEHVPVFIPHKVQYVSLDVVPCFELIENLLKGNKTTEEELKNVSPEKIIVNEKVALGYRFRRDVNKLLKMRKKRKAHNRKFYGEDTNQIISDSKFNEEGVYRF